MTICFEILNKESDLPKNVSKIEFEKKSQKKCFFTVEKIICWKGTRCGFDLVFL